MLHVSRKCRQQEHRTQRKGALPSAGSVTQTVFPLLHTHTWLVDFQRLSWRESAVPEFMIAAAIFGVWPSPLSPTK